jgi:hypothetical protein
VLNHGNHATGIDPHADTPVEILHVVLLGVVKYFWCDAMKRLSDPQKETVKTRLQGVDVHGLDPELTCVPGHTLLQYAGSLVGQDFRIIAQLGIFILYDLLPLRILNAWAALGDLIPLAWTPMIQDINQHVVCLSPSYVSAKV